MTFFRKYLIEGIHAVVISKSYLVINYCAKSVGQIRMRTQNLGKSQQVRFVPYQGQSRVTEIMSGISVTFDRQLEKFTEKSDFCVCNLQNSKTSRWREKYYGPWKFILEPQNYTLHEL